MQNNFWSGSKNQITGIEIVNVLPFPGVLSTDMVPPCAFIISYAMLRPRPVPWQAQNGPWPCAGRVLAVVRPGRTQAGPEQALALRRPGPGRGQVW